MKKQNRLSMGKRRGFTFPELMAVISIIGILTFSVSVKYTDVRRMARKAVLDSNFSSLKTAIIMYQSKHGILPGDSAGIELTGYIQNAALGTDVFEHLEEELTGSSYRWEWESGNRILICELDEENSGVTGGYKKIYQP